MTNRVIDMRRNAFRAVLAASLFAGAGAMSACKEEAPPPPPPPPPKQAARPVDAQSFVSDPRVQFPQEHAPIDESLARAVANFASALASGDASVIRPMLDNPGRAVLDEQVETGAWERETEGIEVVRVVSLTRNGENASFTLAVQDPRGAYLLGWKAVQSNGESWIIGGAPAPDTRAARASDLAGAVAPESE